MTDQEDMEYQLALWAVSQAKRDDLVWEAFRGGITKHRIAALTGLARTTVDRIVHSRQSTVDYLSLQ